MDEKIIKMCVCVCVCVCVYRTVIFEALCVAHEDNSSIGHCRTKTFRRQLKGHFVFSMVLQDLYLFIYSTSANGTPHDVLRTLV